MSKEEPLQPLETIHPPVVDDEGQESSDDLDIGPADGEDEEMSSLSPNYMESVNKEMEKAAKIIKELEDEVARLRKAP